MGVERIYAVGDIHGQLEKLKEVHDLIEDDRTREGGADTVVHVGDLVDRGPDSAGVLAYLIEGVAAGQPWIVLKGNHDRMMSMYLQETPKRDMRLRAEFEWLHPRLGGQTTLASYGLELVENSEGPVWYRWINSLKRPTPDISAMTQELHAAAQDAIPASHVAFLNSLPTYHQTPGILFVHAGIRPGIPLSEQSEDDLLWIRQEFENHRRPHESLIIHGHTPVDEVTHFGNRINIDTGAAYGRKLSVIVVEAGQFWQLAKSGRVPIITP